MFLNFILNIVDWDFYLMNLIYFVYDLLVIYNDWIIVNVGIFFILEYNYLYIILLLNNDWLYLW